MARKPHVSPSTLAYVERKLACVDQRRSHPPSAAHIARLLDEMRSPDEQIRAQAVRQVCPCRMPWNVFGRVRKAAQRLQKDSSPLVRANARHIEEDAGEIEVLEALREWVMEHEEALEEAPHRPKRRSAGHRERPSSSVR